MVKQLLVLLFLAILFCSTPIKSNAQVETLPAIEVYIDYFDECIGGSSCSYNSYSLPTNGVLIHRVEVFCHDKINKTSEGQLDLIVGGEPTGRKKDVKRDGSIITWFVNQRAASISFNTFHRKNGKKGGEEVHIHYVKVFYEL